MASRMSPGASKMLGLNEITISGKKFGTLSVLKESYQKFLVANINHEKTTNIAVGGVGSYIIIVGEN